MMSRIAKFSLGEGGNGGCVRSLPSPVKVVDGVRPFLGMLMDPSAGIGFPANDTKDQGCFPSSLWGCGADHPD